MWGAQAREAGVLLCLPAADGERGDGQLEVSYLQAGQMPPTVWTLKAQLEDFQGSAAPCAHSRHSSLLLGLRGQASSA